MQICSIKAAWIIIKAIREIKAHKMQHLILYLHIGTK